MVGTPKLEAALLSGVAWLGPGSGRCQLRGSCLPLTDPRGAPWGRERPLDGFRYEEGERELGVSGSFGEAGLGASSLGSEPGSL